MMHDSGGSFRPGIDRLMPLCWFWIDGARHEGNSDAYLPGFTPWRGRDLSRDRGRGRETALLSGGSDRQRIRFRLRSCLRVLYGDEAALRTNPRYELFTDMGE